MEAVEHVEKVRMNPGNYADKKKFAVLEYTDAAYAEELERLHAAFSAGAPRSEARSLPAHRHQSRLAVGPHHEPVRRRRRWDGGIGPRVHPHLRNRTASRTWCCR
jgi:hypothetical protein